jgi:ribonuclease HI
MISTPATTVTGSSISQMLLTLPGLRRAVTKHKNMLGRDEAPLFRSFEKPLKSNDEISRDIEAEIYSDGASSGNPGHAGIGVIIRLVNKPQKNYRISEYIGITTNNVAEYSALLRGLKKARALGFKKIAVYTDSELLEKQLNGVYRVKSETLRPLWYETQNILNQFETCTVSHIQREMNKEADLLAKKAAKKTPES